MPRRAKKAKRKDKDEIKLEKLSRHGRVTTCKYIVEAKDTILEHVLQRLMTTRLYLQSKKAKLKLNHLNYQQMT
ncbi:conserved hypothetical protein [Ricinus communis]|uniref:Uncharacterized protein n=1 Tax=Ricinus communis TaxID=3988 RepID=B9SQ47_RICCO|nr:conserved hypothetical protein [Ricinus communis]